MNSTLLRNSVKTESKPRIVLIKEVDEDRKGGGGGGGGEFGGLL